MTHRSPPQQDSPADEYGGFMTALMGLQDDAQLAGYSQAGVKLLDAAIAVFGAEFDARYPGHGR
jgi:hypothetical protein